jgi:hypothetical protein
VRDWMRDADLWVRLSDVRVPSNSLTTGLVAVRLGQVLRVRAADRTNKALSDELAQLRAVESERLAHEARRVEQGDETSTRLLELQEGVHRLSDAGEQREREIVEARERIDALTASAGTRRKQVLGLAVVLALVIAGLVAVAIWR